MSKPEAPRLPAAAAARPPSGPRSIIRLSVGPSPELLAFLGRHPGGQIVIRFPGDPGYSEAVAAPRAPAFTIESRHDDRHACGSCRGTFQVAYPSRESPRVNVAVTCPRCGAGVAVPLPAGIDPGQIITRPEANGWAADLQIQ